MADSIYELKQLVGLCTENPSLLQTQSLAFFKGYLERMGAKIPSASPISISINKKMVCCEDKVNGNAVEFDVELDDTNIVEADDDPLQRMGDPLTEVTAKNLNAAHTLKSKAEDALTEGKRPFMDNKYSCRNKETNAAMCDADVALQIKPEPVKGHEMKGRVLSMLGHWNKALIDLRAALGSDYYEEISSILEQVETNVKDIEEHQQNPKLLHKGEEHGKVGQDSRRRQAKAQGTNEMDMRKEHPSNFAAGTASASKDGQVIGIHSGAELETMLNAASIASRLVLLNFSAAWCGPCKFISPIFEELSGKYREAFFLKVDTDEAPEVAKMWNITHLPTTCFVKNGKEVDRVMIIDKSSFENKITEHAG